MTNTLKQIMYGKNGEVIKGIAFNSKGGILEALFNEI